MNHFCFKLDESQSESDTDSESDNETTNEVNFIIDSKPDNDLEISDRKPNKKPILGSELTDDLKVCPYLSFNEAPEQSVKRLDQMSVKTMNEDLSKKLVIKPGFEQNFCVEPLHRNRRVRKKMRQIEREKTLGKQWFGMSAEEMTEEKKNDLLALRMRKAWDPKRFYKKNDNKELPKFFQVGTIIESKADFYHSRIPKKDRKRTLVEELLADANFKRNTKKRYSEALAKNPYYLKMKRRKERKALKEKGFQSKRKNKSRNERKGDRN